MHFSTNSAARTTTAPGTTTPCQKRGDRTKLQDTPPNKL